jgi:hypothetical protein
MWDNKITSYLIYKYYLIISHFKHILIILITYFIIARFHGLYKSIDLQYTLF